MSARQAELAASGDLGMQVIRNPRPLGELSMQQVSEFGFPHRGQEELVRKFKIANLPNLMRGLSKVRKARRHGIPHFYGALWLKQVIDGEELDLGLVSLRVVTNNGVAAIVDAFQNTFELEAFRFHGIGTGVVAEAATDAALGAELTTQYSVDNTRATGTLTEGAANVFRTVATNTVDAAVAITEHGIFSQAATGGGVLLDRSVFSAVNLASGDSLQTTYDLTVNAGG